MSSKNTPMRGKKRPRNTLKTSKQRHRKKPKYLSLKLQLCNKQEEEEEEEEGDKRLIELFPLRPKNNNSQVKDDNKVVVDLQDDHVAFLFEAATDGASTTLDGLLDSSLTAATSSDERDPLSPSLSCVYSYRLSSDLQTHLPRQALRSRGGCGANSLLVRAAMRSKERAESKEERWVSYNEVVEGISTSTTNKKEQEEVTSCCGIGFGCDDASWVKIEKDQQLVGLKLNNYQDILDAWSDKDPFCLGHSNAQIVPDLHAASSKVWLEGWNNSDVGNLWRVPEVDAHIQLKEKERDKEQEGSKWEQREASMLRYKKKRQSRLFAKRIRYEVRKLNAEKRPRFKGRFVKRSGEP